MEFDLFSYGNSPATNPNYFIENRDTVGSIAEQPKGSFLNGAFDGLLNTAVGAGQSYLNAWASGQANKATSEQNDRAVASGETTGGSFFGLNSTTGTGLALVVAGIVGLFALIFVTRK
tara:strand:- start:611 stop:964 length:354 start_codon:yes stop_codon:yes gene_type:complete